MQYAVSQAHVLQDRAVARSEEAVRAESMASQLQSQGEISAAGEMTAHALQLRQHALADDSKAQQLLSKASQGLAEAALLQSDVEASIEEMQFAESIASELIEAQAAFGDADAMKSDSVACFREAVLCRAKASEERDTAADIDARATQMLLEVWQLHQACCMHLLPFLSVLCHCHHLLQVNFHPVH